MERRLLRPSTVPPELFPKLPPLILILIAPVLNLYSIDTTRHPRAQMPHSAAPPVEVNLPDEYMKIAQLRFSASQGKAGAAAELLKLIKKHGV